MGKDNRAWNDASHVIVKRNEDFGTSYFAYPPMCHATRESVLVARDDIERAVDQCWLIGEVYLNHKSYIVRNSVF
jgi:hypothetical protein